MWCKKYFTSIFVENQIKFRAKSNFIWSQVLPWIPYEFDKKYIFRAFFDFIYYLFLFDEKYEFHVIMKFR